LTLAQNAAHLLCDEFCVGVSGAGGPPIFGALGAFNASSRVSDTLSFEMLEALRWVCTKLGRMRRLWVWKVAVEVVEAERNTRLLFRSLREAL
jgi:hypothetical protein